MARETVQVAEYASSLRYEDIPADVLEAAKNTIADGIAACIFGYRFPWSQAIVRFAQRSDAGGMCPVLGPNAPSFHPPLAALVNGALAHSFELDGGTHKGVGAHPFGTVFTAALPVAQANRLSGRSLLTAFIAGSEVMLRIGKATRRSNEHRGFHAPGTTGPFGAAIACALLLGLDLERLLNAIGIAGSLASGLRQFNVSDTGSMVKRLHFGRAAEGGVVAASLAAEGLDGPHDILEGKAGFLKVFCDDYNLSELNVGLDGSVFVMREIAMKRFGTHGASQIPLQALYQLRAQHPFTANDIESLEILAARESVEHHDNFSPTDLMQAQYSVPFCVALACVSDIRDPRVVEESALKDPKVRAILTKIRFSSSGKISDKRACELTVRLKGGATYTLAWPEAGVPWKRASRDETYEKYSILMGDCPRAAADQLFERIQDLESQDNVDWLKI